MINDRNLLKFEWKSVSEVGDAEVEEFTNLFSEHYGHWSPKGINPGRRIRLTPKKIKSGWFREDTWVATCRYADQLVGYAFTFKINLPNLGTISWVTQLVVHSSFRSRKIATELLQSIWAFSDDFAWGLVTANPYTVRALEKATHRRCDPSRIRRHSHILANIGESQTDFIKKENIILNREKSAVDTEFHVDHSDIDEKLSKVSQFNPWNLGELNEGEEWLAFTFRDQEPFELTNDEFDLLMDDSERIVRQAYERMNLGSSHLWTSKTNSETDFITSELQISPGARLLDFGCGAGRHSLALSKLGINVVGVDFISNNILHARMMAVTEEIQNIQFHEGDCRTISLNEKFDYGICLYDVIGSFRNNEHNSQILKNIITHISPGGKILISVMNSSLTKKRAIHRGILPRDLYKISTLNPSHTMEETGNIFNPDYYFFEESTSVVYRKEQFNIGYNLPTQTLVADRRYTIEELDEMCESAGLRKIWSRHVKLGDWKNSIAEDHPSAKEILFLGQK